MDEERIKRIIRAVTMAVLFGLGEAVDDEEREAKQGPNCAVMCMVAYPMPETNRTPLSRV